MRQQRFVAQDAVERGAADAELSGSVSEAVKSMLATDAGGSSKQGCWSRCPWYLWHRMCNHTIWCSGCHLYLMLTLVDFGPALSQELKTILDFSISWCLVVLMDIPVHLNKIPVYSLFWICMSYVALTMVNVIKNIPKQQPESPSPLSEQKQPLRFCRSFLPELVAEQLPLFLAALDRSPCPLLRWLESA